ncbi:helix-turn-helix domain-containing protein [Sphingobacterium faecium]|uniref:helix-turn-helix domain-containing protein n=1 Tax=Sphingobacterium faecium TaxID=34087 RepID=UPI002478A2BD|nr:helix-turn-helix transcriptional regulator [Sphingobacterium faecium]WGQ15621.1 helix-turn-helix transcriptional regulator [Sphingobacterium faecium]
MITQEAKRFKDFRKSIGLTQVELADDLGIKQDVISRYESGKYVIPLDVVKFLYTKYKLNYVWFFHGFGKKIVDEKAKATLTTDLKEVLLENNILKEKIKVLEGRFEKLDESIDKRLRILERLQS